ncbi:MAG: hypothetical protein AVDCRST_MAG10-3628 [uncultured Acidimicrobiales bacterium]|uniref:CAAX prenyl protease 2/Lysostaphin resistance protein A-like domain-containing protein n=1 Tax=uncultured Acidimicrobiales bacterium TaxID=310071 RepID=A0A6J4JFD3_9ACTN|nr:MAG: hypothetical protein AVDCRST_MAG10-3628 [uncultured Acidimicrobiales bacterium]
MTEVAIVGLLVVHNLVTNLWLSDRWYVPVNVATAVVLVLMAGPGGLGLSVGWVPGVVGLAFGLVVVAVVASLAVLPSTRPLLADQRMVGVDARGTACRALVRIPLGTVLLEEVAFRGVLPVVLSPLAAVVLFGLWHIVPTWRTLDVNRVAGSGRARAAAVSGAVVVTAAVGLVLWRLRVATGSLLAPALVHIAANSAATVAAYGVLRSAAAHVAAADLLPDEAAQQAEEEPA